MPALAAPHAAGGHRDSLATGATQARGRRSVLPEPRPQGCLPAAAAPSTRDPGSRSRQPSRARVRPGCVVRRAWSNVQSALDVFRSNLIYPFQFRALNIFF